MLSVWVAPVCRVQRRKLGEAALHVCVCMTACTATDSWPMLFAAAPGEDDVDVMSTAELAGMAVEPRFDSSSFSIP